MMNLQLRSVQEPGKLSDRVADELQRRILQRELEPGTFLPTEVELCEMLGVSRSVVRDAIRALVTRGLVSVRQGSGTMVRTPDDSALSQAILLQLARSDITVGDVLDARAAIETGLVPLAAERSTPDDWAHLSETFGAFEQAVAEARWQDASDAHHSFHMDLFGALHLPALEVLLQPLAGVVMKTSSPPVPGVAEFWEVSAHRPILDSLKARNAGRLRAALAGHFAEMQGEDYDAFRSTSFLRSEPGARGNGVRRRS